MVALAPRLLDLSHPTTLPKLQASPTNLRQRQSIRRLRFSGLPQMIILAVSLTNLIRYDILLFIVSNDLRLFPKGCPFVMLIEFWWLMFWLMVWLVVGCLPKVDVTLSLVL